MDMHINDENFTFDCGSSVGNFKGRDAILAALLKKLDAGMRLNTKQREIMRKTCMAYYQPTAFRVVSAELLCCHIVRHIDCHIDGHNVDPFYMRIKILVGAQLGNPKDKEGHICQGHLLSA